MLPIWHEEGTSIGVDHMTGFDESNHKDDKYYHQYGNDTIEMKKGIDMMEWI